MEKPEITNKQQENLERIEDLMRRLRYVNNLDSREHQIIHDTLEIVRDLIKEVYEDINQL